MVPAPRVVVAADEVAAVKLANAAMSKEWLVDEGLLLLPPTPPPPLPAAASESRSPEYYSRAALLGGGCGGGGDGRDDVNDIDDDSDLAATRELGTLPADFGNLWGAMPFANAVSPQKGIFTMGQVLCTSHAPGAVTTSKAGSSSSKCTKPGCGRKITLCEKCGVWQLMKSIAQHRRKCGKAPKRAAKKKAPEPMAVDGRALDDDDDDDDDDDEEDEMADDRKRRS